MDGLRKKLDRVLETARFKVRVTRAVDLRKSAEEFGSVTIKSRGESEEKLSAKELGELYGRRRYDPGTTTWVDVSAGEDGAGAMAALTEELRTVLAAFVEPSRDAVGHGLHWIRSPRGQSTGLASGLIACESLSTVAQLTEALAMAGSCLGSERACEHVSAWVAGDPLHYRTCMLLVNADVEAELESGGIRIARLPDSMSALPAHLPTGESWPVQQLLRGVEMSVDTWAKPVLFRPEGWDYWEQKVRPQCVLGDGERLLDGFCESLSLAANACVYRKGMWMDYGDLTAFGFSESRVSTGPWEVKMAWSKVQLDLETLERAWKIHGLRCRGSKKARRVETAIDRWMRSMDTCSRLSDRFIEFRVALEALYLDSGQHELRFRLAVHGAWDLGSTPARREAYHKVLREAYDLGSQAVHMGVVEENESSLRVLREGQDACRAGILKRLERGSAPNWLQLVLGQEDSGTA